MHFQPEHDVSDATASLAPQRLLAGAIATMVLLVVGMAVAQVGFSTSSPGVAPIAVRGAAIGVVVDAPGRAAQAVASAEPVANAGTGTTEQVLAAYAVPADGSLLRAARVWTNAASDDATSIARGRADVGSLELLGGRVKLTGLSLRGSANVQNGVAGGNLALAPGSRLVVDGVVTALTPNKVVVLAGVGSVTLNEQALAAAAPHGDAQTGPRYRVVGAVAHIRLTHAAGGLPAGTQIVIGRVDAGVRQGKVQAVAAVTQAPVPVAGGAVSQYPSHVSMVPVALAGPGSVAPHNVLLGTPKPGDSALPRKATDVKASAPAAPGGTSGYVFPVLGDVTYSDDYGAPRGDMDFHHGNDIFGQEGTPLVAVADGTLDRVGWNAIGGYRLWVYDQYGNGFYYAHLSAFSPLAVDGAHVHAGDVIGFMGHTGDAQGTPTHLHFEVHPAGGESTNPHPYLEAWKHGSPLAIGTTVLGGAGATGVSGDRLPGLALLDVSDIGARSGLADPAAAARAGATRPVSAEGTAVPTDQSLRAAIEGGAIN